MRKFLIMNIEGYIYTLFDNENYYIKNLYFNSFNPIIGDILYLNESMLYEKVLTFDLLDSKYGKDVYLFSNDLIIIERNKEKKYMKRIYG